MPLYVLALHLLASGGFCGIEMRAEGLLLCSIEFAGIGSGKQASKQARDEGAADSFPMAICMEKRDVNT